METLLEANRNKTWVDVCDIGDLLPNSGVCALVHGQQVAIFYFPDEHAIHAIHNYDPIGKANVLSRGVVGDIRGEIVVASPLYKQHFSLLTGHCLENPEVSVAIFPARISGTTVQVGCI